jgi:hypothetical protein
VLFEQSVGNGSGCPACDAKGLPSGIAFSEALVPFLVSYRVSICFSSSPHSS